MSKTTAASFVLLLASAVTDPASAAPSLELYGNFHTMGVIVTIAGADDPNSNAVASVSYRVGGSGGYRQGFPLSRITSTRFAGSLFWLQPGTAYDVTVAFTDADHHPLDGASVSSTASTRAEVGVPSAAASYYVSPTGSGTTCSAGSPCSLTEGLSRAQAGDAVVLRGGTYYEGEFSLPRSGSAGAPIVIRSYPGETAVLDGGDPGAFTWTAQGGGVYRATVNAADPHLITASGQRLMPYTSLSDLQNLVWGVPGLYASGTTAYVRLAGDANPNSVTMVVSRYNNAFFVDRDYIYFVDLVFRHYGQGDYPKAIYFYSGSNNLVQGCTFAINDLAIGIKYASHRNLIQNNVFYDTIFDWPWDAFYAGIDLSGGGIRFYDPVDGRGNVIRRNTFHDYFDGFGACPDSTSGQTNETDVYENVVYNCGDDGMETDGQASNVRIWGNTFHDVLMGISVAPVYTGPVYCVRNLIYLTGVGNNSYTGSPFKFNSGYSQSGPIYLFHNTGDAALAGNHGLDIKSPGSWSLIYARNNIWSGTDQAINDYNTGNPTDLDYDDLYTTAAGKLVRWNSTNYSTLSAFTAGTGQESHGLNAAPAFSNAAGGDYTLSAGSALADKGLVIPGINDDYMGAAPDMGAFERAGQSCPVSVSPQTQVFSSAGGAGSFGVSAGGGCSYTASTSDAWITVTNGASGTTSGTVGFSVGANGSSSGRTGTIVVQTGAGSSASFVVVQYGQGQSCNYAVGAFDDSFAADGGTEPISVTADAGCVWAAVSNATWVTFSKPAGIGSDTFTMTVASNASSAARSAVVTIAEQESTITQDGRAGSGPAISSVTSRKAKPGTQARIKGSGFSSSSSQNTVYFGKKKATVKRASTTQLTVTIPKGLKKGTLYVYVVVGGKSSNKVPFTVK
ncbi:MAG: BACON domain-containing carbohydrate-binding protein [Acidobacteriota bacterium]